MSEASNESETSNDSDASNDSGFPWGKSCLGCGCLIAVVALCGLGGTIIGGGYIAQTMLQQAKEDYTVAAETQEKRKEAFRSNVKDVSVTLDSPVTKADFEGLETTVDDWRQSESFQTLETIAESDTTDGSDGEPSLGDQVWVVWQMWNFTSTLKDLGDAYTEAIEDNGGYETHYNRVVRNGAVIAAAYEIASNGRFRQGETPVSSIGDPPSDSVATLLADHHDWVLKQFDEDELKRLRSESHTLQKLAEEGDLGAYAIARLPAESFDAWKQLGQKRRKELLTNYGWCLVAEGVTFGGLAFPVDLGPQLPWE